MTSRAARAFSQRLLQILDLPHGILLAAATAISFLYSGYSSVYNNNIYHIPILLERYDLPQFAGDPFIQSLRHFSSGFWIVFAGAGQLVDVKLFLTLGLLVTHFAFFAAALHLARSLGLTERRPLALFLILVCISPLTYGYTVGDGGILLNYFTHSELANASLLLGLSFALRRRYAAAAIATCFTFFLNAFMAVWMVPPLVLLAGYQLATGQHSLRRLVIAGAAGLAVGSPLLILPLHNILQNPQLGGEAAFSYPEFLWAFFPYHFFVTSLSTRQLGMSGVSIFVLLLSARLLGAQSRPFLMVALGAVGVLVLAALAPVLTDSRMVLNLHLLRGFVMVAMLSLISVAVLASRWLLDPSEASLKTLGVGLAVALAAGKIGLLLSALLLFVELWRGLPIMAKLLGSRITRIGAACLFALCEGSALLASGTLIEQLRQEAALQKTWEEIGRWAKASTPPEAVFQVVPDGALGFSLTSERPLWFDGKYGAAVMWSPSYYPIWKDRRAVQVDRSLIDRKVPGMDFLAMPCDDSVTQAPVHSQDGICVYKLT